MRCEWKIYTLNQTCTNIYSGGTPSTKQSLFWNGDVNWLSSSETSKHFIYDTKKKITSVVSLSLLPDKAILGDK